MSSLFFSFYLLNSNIFYMSSFLVISLLFLFFKAIINYFFASFFSNGSSGNTLSDCSFSFNSNSNSNPDRNKKDSFFKKYKSYVFGFSFLVIISLSVYYLYTLDVTSSMSGLGSAYELSRFDNTTQVFENTPVVSTVNEFSTHANITNESIEYGSLKDFIEANTEELFPPCKSFSNDILNYMVDKLADESFSDFKRILSNASGRLINDDSSLEELREAFFKLTSLTFSLFSDNRSYLNTYENQLKFIEKLEEIFYFHLRKSK